MTQKIRSSVLAFTMLATAVVSSTDAFGANTNKLTTCADSYRQASFEYLHTSKWDEQTIKTSAAVGTGGSALVFAGFAVAKAKVVGGMVAGAMVGASAYVHWSTCNHLDRMENAAMIYSVYENVRSLGDGTDIPEGQDLLLQTFADQTISSNCSLYSFESLSTEKRQAELDKVPAASKKLVLEELVSRMDSGELCDKGNVPKNLGDIVAELKNYERTKTRGTY